MSTVTAKEALSRLIEGNQRYINNLKCVKSLSHFEKRPTLVAAQNPFAIVLSCSDSRVPSEIVFDQGLGDLFVVRVAGNIVAPSLVGSIEFAASTFGTQLVVVMGHSKCGAVQAALDCQLSGQKIPSANIRDIVDRISPSIETVVQNYSQNKDFSKEQLLDHCIRSNIDSSIHHLSKDSLIIRNLISENKLQIVGAEYCLTSGEVSFLDPMNSIELNNLKSNDFKSRNFKKLYGELINAN